MIKSGQVAKKSGLLATFKNGFDHEKWLTYAVCGGLWPLSHFFFYLIVIKSFNNIINRPNKSGFLTKTISARLCESRYLQGLLWKGVVKMLKKLPKEFKQLAGFGALVGIGCMALTYVYGEIRYSEGSVYAYNDCKNILKETFNKETSKPQQD